MTVSEKNSQPDYRAPTLVVYGDVTVLTAGGSGAMTEANPGGKCEGSGLTDINRTKC